MCIRDRYLPILDFRHLIGQYVTIHDDVISHMNISEVESIDGGAYTCKAINAVGTVTHTARINVYGKIILYILSFMVKVNEQYWYFCLKIFFQCFCLNDNGQSNVRQGYLTRSNDDIKSKYERSQLERLFNIHYLSFCIFIIIFPSESWWYRCWLYGIGKERMITYSQRQ